MRSVVENELTRTNVISNSFLFAIRAAHSPVAVAAVVAMMLFRYELLLASGAETNQ